jgi:hypothetical protein
MNIFYGWIFLLTCRFNRTVGLRSIFWVLLRKNVASFESECSIMSELTRIRTKSEHTIFAQRYGVCYSNGIGYTYVTVDAYEQQQG